MKLYRWQIVLARLLFLAYIFLTASYCLLAYIPFTYQQVHVGQLLPWLTRLVHFHAALAWPALGIVLLTIWPDLRSGPSRHLARAFAVAAVVAAAGITIHPLLPNLANDAGSLQWSLVSLIPLLWLGAIDWEHGRRAMAWPDTAEDDTSRCFFAALAASVYVSALYFLIGYLRVSSSSLQLRLPQWTVLLCWSLFSHALIFFLLFVGFDIADTAASFAGPWRVKAASLAPILAAAALIALGLRYIVLPQFSLQGSPAWMVAAAIAVSLVTFAAGTGMRLQKGEGNTSRQGLDLLFAPLDFLRKANWIIRGFALLALAGFAWLLSAQFGRMDWEFLLQKITAMLVWAIAFAILYTITPQVPQFTRVLAYAAGTLVLAGYFGLLALLPKSAEDTGFAADMTRILDESGGYDISFRLVDTMLRPQPEPQTADAGAFYSFLAANTNIPRSTHINAPDIHLVSQLEAASGPKPHIFFFVIDSLRRDYLSPYNPDVTFTPAISALARDSVVFQNTFTRYGGTGLSEPSIWVGGLMAHQQYISPFAPMNSLQKLLEVNHYREWISKDNVLQQILPASPNIVELDEHIGAMYYDLCHTLQEVTQKLPSAADSSDPIFIYTQPQNIHVSVIDREGRSVPEGAIFPAPFNAAYASRVQRMDTCLGAFIDALKAQGMYDNSLIVVTSDHGDALGERGRWGHAYTIFPEIIRIPLIVHLPSQWRGKVVDDTQSVAFLTDLTPTLYYLLGQQPLLNDPLLGRPLFTTTLEEQKPYMRDAYLLISSYAPVYGLLTHNGQQLYIADGVNYKDYSYELFPDGSNREAEMTERQREDAQEQIRQQIEAIARFYRIQ